MKHFLFFASLFLFFTGNIYPQIDTLKTELDQIVVTATRTETSISKIASSISVITSADLQKRHTASLTEILNETPGVFIANQGGFGTLASIFMRGSNSHHTMVLIDGIEQNDPASPNNSFDFANLLSDNIERVEILRGPQSTLYGSDAMAGVINVITAKGSGKPSFSFSGEGGSNEFVKTNFASKGTYHKLNYALSYSKLRTAGISAISNEYGAVERDGYNNNSVIGRVGYSIITNAEINLLYSFQNTNTDLDRSSIQGDDPNYTYSTETQQLRFEYKWNLFSNMWKQIFSAGYIKRITKADDRADDNSPDSFQNYTNSNRMKYNWQNELNIIPDNIITFGAEYEKEQARSDFHSDGTWGPYSSIFPMQFAEIFGAYLQDQININNSLFASLGMRYDKHNKFGNVITYRIAPVFLISQTSTKIKATFGTGFKAPSLYYLFDPAFGNPDLNPEKSRGWDAGFEQYLFNGKFIFGAVYFSSAFENLIGFDQNFKAINIDKAETSGFEITSLLKNFFGFDISASFTYTDTRDKSEISPDKDLRLLRRPQSQSSVNINYQWNAKLNMNANFRFVGERFDKNFEVFPAERVSLAAYSLVDLAASYELTKFLGLYGRITNLFDEKYEDVLYYGALGRAFYAGLRIKI